MVNSIYFFLVCLGSVIFCIWVFYFLKTPFFRLSTLAVKQVDIILSSSLDDVEKDRRILKNLGFLFYFLVKTYPTGKLPLVNFSFSSDLCGQRF
mgnify:FL=1